MINNFLSQEIFYIHIYFTNIFRIFFAVLAAQSQQFLWSSNETEIVANKEVNKVAENITLVSLSSFKNEVAESILAYIKYHQNSKFAVLWFTKKNF